MEVLQVLHMNKGAGETSYAKNSTVQSKILRIAKPVTEEAILELVCTNFPDSMGIADLGCSCGPNVLLVISEIIDAIYGKCRILHRQSPEFRVYLNDLPSNDFNDIFGSLPAFYNRLREEKGSEFGPCFISGVPGSFYGRLFPANSLHFVHSSSSLHWLSQVPAGLESKASTALNKGKIYISKTSPLCVLEAYLEQFQKDFSLFLKSRAEEIVPGGRMVLSFMGRSCMDPTTQESCYHWELLAQALMSMVSEGVSIISNDENLEPTTGTWPNSHAIHLQSELQLIAGLVEEEKVDSFNAPYYAPCPEELKSEIQKEGSFIIDRLETFEIDWDEGGDTYLNNVGDEDECIALGRQSGRRVAKTIRAVVESLLESHFGRDIMDDLFRRYGEIVGDHLTKTRTKYINLVISIIKKG